jgi:cytochrome c oxidase assembly protein subunit 15
MFAFPPSQWVGGIFYEHTHRLWASAVGLMTTILAVWIWLKDSRSWLKWLGFIAFLLVIAQGVLGGLRVTMKLDSLGIFHGVIAQAFFVLMCAIAFFTGNIRQNLSSQTRVNVSGNLRRLVLATAILIFLQLILGATMRHQHAGLAISDFPLAHGKIWPAIDPDAIARYNADRMETTNIAPITAFQIILQLIHRIMAFGIFILMAICAMQAWRQLGRRDALTKLAIFWFALILLQIGLGIGTVLSDKAADIATAHVLIGALSLMTGALWYIIALGRSSKMPKTANEPFGAFGNLAVNK